MQPARRDGGHNRNATYNPLGRAHKRLGNKIGYPTKLKGLQYVADINATITEGIAAKEFSLGETYSDHGDIGRVRESLKHCVRDWSEA
jgi:hypothetical protein